MIRARPDPILTTAHKTRIVSTVKKYRVMSEIKKISTVIHSYLIVWGNYPEREKAAQR